ncbi:MAG: hypothetical protein M3Z03_02450 [Actinomycetota bacterium]|nr:hypothetical protein [Actinomycetota bacterium]
MNRSFELPELEDRSHTVLGAVANRVRMTEGQLYTVVLALLFVAALLLTGLPGAHKTESNDGIVVPPPAAEVAP